MSLILLKICEINIFLSDSLPSSLLLQYVLDILSQTSLTAKSPQAYMDYGPWSHEKREGV